MSVYNGNVQTSIIDPVFNQNSFKSEWRFNQNTAYLSNMRLVNMGYGDSTLVRASLLNPQLGNWCIKSVQLYDGNVLLDQVLEASKLQAFQTFNKSHDENSSVESQLQKTSMSFITLGDQDVDAGIFKPDNIKVKGLMASLNVTSQDPESTRNDAWFSLKGYLGFLTSSLIVPTNVFKNLRLVVNWKTPTELRAQTPAQVIVDYKMFDNVSLVVDEMIGDSSMAAMNNYQGLVYRAYEHDSVNVPEITGIPANEEQVQNNTFLMNGFDNKQVERMVLIQSPTNPATYTDSANNLQGAADACSMAQLKTQVNLRINGKNKLPHNGFTRQNQKLAQLTDSYGESTVVPSSQYVNIPSFNNLLSIGTGGQDLLDVQGLVGKNDYTCVEVRDNVKELVLDFSRSGVAGNTDLNQALTLILMGEVNKAISVRPDKSYVVQYL